ncbi:MAG: spore germination protein, partial [Bacillota bacterium]|nr:spore germination protein [Bacillota bacterium]
MKKKTIRERINEILSNRTDNPGEKAKKEKLGQKLKENLKLIEDIIGFSDDVVVREFQLGGKTGIEAAIIFVDGLTDKQVINENILKPLLIEKFPGDELKDPARSDIIKFIKDKTITINELKIVDQLEKVIDGVLDGDTALLVDGYIDTFLLNTRGWDKRSISEPQSETVVRGPRDSFTENFRTNTALIRRRIK